MARMNATSRRWAPQQSLLVLLLSLVLGLLLLPLESAARKYTVFRGPVLILENDAVAAAPSKACVHAAHLCVCVCVWIQHAQVDLTGFV